MNPRVRSRSTSQKTCIYFTPYFILKGGEYARLDLLDIAVRFCGGGSCLLDGRQCQCGCNLHLVAHQQRHLHGPAGPHWNTPSFWTGTGSSYPQNAGDVAILNIPLTSNQSVNLPDAAAPTVGYTLGTLIMGDAGTGNTAGTDGGTSFFQTLYNTERHPHLR